MKHLPTGKNKEQFEEWYKNNPSHSYLEPNNPREFSLKEFYTSDVRMQSGVLTAYYDSLGIEILMKLIRRGDECFYTSYIHNINWEGVYFGERQEALTEAFEQANNLINKL